MPKQLGLKKETISVSLAWFSSGPVFETALSTVCEALEQYHLNDRATTALRKLVSLNGGKPFTGETHYGPHTYIHFEAKNLSHAVLAANALQGFLQHKFPNLGRGTGGIQVRFANKALTELLELLETALENAQTDLKLTRRFWPSKSLKELRQTLDAFHA